MKKFISVLLTVAILFGVVAIGASAEEPVDLKFAVASDLHYVCPEEELEKNIDYEEVFWHANRRAELQSEAGFIIDEFLRQCAEDDSCEFVLIPGDLVNDGRVVVQQHIDVAKKLADFEDSTGKQVYVINGNHDCADNEGDFSIAEFKQMYYRFGWDEAIATDDDSNSYVVDLSDKYRLIALDSCHKNASTEDGMDFDRIMWVCDQAKAATEAGKYPILMMHHNLLDHLPVQRIISQNFIVKFHFTTADLFANSGIKLVFSGHEHCSDAAVYTSSLGNKIYDFANTCLIMYPLEYRMMTLTENEIKYESKTIESIDVDALTSTVSGYTDEHIALMNEDMNNYAYEFFKASIQYRLGRDLKLESMGLDEDAIYYPLVSRVINELNDSLEKPLYGEDSVQQRAADFGIEIPESDYENLWDLVTDLVSFHYAGGEYYDLYSTEVQILLRSVAMLLRTEFAILGDETLFKIAELFLDDMGMTSVSEELMQLGIATFGEISAVEYALLALVSPLIYSFAYDDDGVHDNDGVIEGYGTKTVEGNLANISDKITTFVSKVVFYLLQAAEIALKIIM